MRAAACSCCTTLSISSQWQDSSRHQSRRCSAPVSPPAQSKTSLILMNQKGTRACSFFRKSCWLRTTQHIHLSTANVYLRRARHACSHQLEFLHNTTLNLSVCIIPVVVLPYFISLPSKGSTPDMGPTCFICKKCRRKFEPC